MNLSQRWHRPLAPATLERRDIWHDTALAASRRPPSRPDPKKASDKRKHGASDAKPATPNEAKQAQRQKKLNSGATLATKRVSSFAEQRLKKLQLSEEELAQKVAAMQPFIDTVRESMDDTDPSKEGVMPAGRGRGVKRGAIKQLLDKHNEVFSLALDLELQEEWQESEDRLRSWSWSRLEAEGLALFGLHAALDHALFKDTIIKMYVPSQPLPFHQLSQGDIVLLSHGVRPGSSPADDPAALEGVLLDYSGRWLRVAVPATVAGAVRGPGWRIDMYANSVSYERCAAALDRFVSGPHDGGEGEAGAAGAASAQDVWRVLTGSLPAVDGAAEALASAPPGWARGKDGPERIRVARKVAAQLAAGQLTGLAASHPAASGPASAAGPAAATAAGPGISSTAGEAAIDGGIGGVGGLNDSQAAAVQAALGRSLTLWQGPPGTGKTRTLLRFVKAALAGIPPGRQVLASAASNVAVDNLVGGLLQLGVKVVRMGQPAKVSAALHSVTLEACVLRTSRGQQAAGLRKQAMTLSGSEAWGLIQQALELEEGAAQEVLSGCSVIAATCIAAGDPRLVMQGRTFPLMVLDEATQATEPASLVAVMAKTESLLLVGDPQQLPPTVKSRPAERLGLGVPLFQRLQAQGLQPMLLSTQYRMHPSICDFPSAAFYQGRLQSHPTPADRPAPAGFPWPVPQVPVCFVPVRGGGEQRTSSSGEEEAAGTGSFSLFNAAEAQQVLSALERLLVGRSLLAGAGDIGVITPYNGQVRHLQRLVQRMGTQPSDRPGATPSRAAGGGGSQARPGTQPGQSRTALSSGDRGHLEGQRRPPGMGGAAGSQGWGQEPMSQLEVKSVDGFQGREKEVIVFSAVRSNPQGAVGFLSDYRRLNVAITRAKRGLVVVGDPDTLRRDPTWRAWLSWSESRGLWLQQPLVPFSPPAPVARQDTRLRVVDALGVRRLPGSEPVSIAVK